MEYRHPAYGRCTILRQIGAHALVRTITGTVFVPLACLERI